MPFSPTSFPLARPCGSGCTDDGRRRRGGGCVRVILAPEPGARVAASARQETVETEISADASKWRRRTLVTVPLSPEGRFAINAVRHAWHRKAQNSRTFTGTRIGPTATLHSPTANYLSGSEGHEGFSDLRPRRVCAALRRKARAAGK